MSQPDDLRPVERRLGGFTPATDLDRDVLLFQAGAASVRTSRWWPTACLLLAVGQAVSLGLWMLPPRHGESPLIVEQAVRPSEKQGPEMIEVDGHQREGSVVGESLPPLPRFADLTPPGPPLHAFAAFSSELGLQ